MTHWHKRWTDDGVECWGRFKHYNDTELSNLYLIGTRCTRYTGAVLYNKVYTVRCIQSIHGVQTAGAAIMYITKSTIIYTRSLTYADCTVLWYHTRIYTQVYIKSHYILNYVTIPNNRISGRFNYNFRSKFIKKLSFIWWNRVGNISNYI